MAVCGRLFFNKGHPVMCRVSNEARFHHGGLNPFSSSYRQSAVLDQATQQISSRLRSEVTTNHGHILTPFKIPTDITLSWLSPAFTVLLLSDDGLGGGVVQSTESVFAAYRVSSATATALLTIEALFSGEKTWYILTEI